MFIHECGGKQTSFLSIFDLYDFLPLRGQLIARLNWMFELTHPKKLTKIYMQAS